MIHAREDYMRIQDPHNLIPDDEPVFLLRGRDVAAAEVVLHWADIAAEFGASEEIVAMAREHAQKMRDWRNNRYRYRTW